MTSLILVVQVEVTYERSEFLFIIYPRVAQWGLVYEEIMDEIPSRPALVRKTGAILLIIGAFGGLILGNLFSMGFLDSGFLAAGFGSETSGTILMALGMSPAIILMIIALCLL